MPRVEGAMPWVDQAMVERNNALCPPPSEQHSNAKWWHDVCAQGKEGPLNNRTRSIATKKAGSSAVTARISRDEVSVACRSATIPAAFRGKVWLRMSEGADLLEKNPNMYNSAHKGHFDCEATTPIADMAGKIGKVPTFGALFDLERLCLSPEGVLRAKRVLLCLAYEHQQAEYCPWLPVVIASALHWMNETQAFALGCGLLKEPAMLNETKLGTWLMLASVHDLAVSHLSKPFAQLCQIEGVAYPPPLNTEHPLRHFFFHWVADCMPFWVLMRFIDLLICEGSKVFYRFGLATLRRWHRQAEHGHMRTVSLPANPPSDEDDGLVAGNDSSPPKMAYGQANFNSSVPSSPVRALPSSPFARPSPSPLMQTKNPGSGTSTGSGTASGAASTTSSAPMQLLAVGSSTSLISGNGRLSPVPLSSSPSKFAMPVPVIHTSSSSPSIPLGSMSPINTGGVGRASPSPRASPLCHERQLSDPSAIPRSISPRPITPLTEAADLSSSRKSIEQVVSSIASADGFVNEAYTFRFSSDQVRKSMERSYAVAKKAMTATGSILAIDEGADDLRARSNTARSLFGVMITPNIVGESSIITSLDHWSLILAEVPSRFRIKELHLQFTTETSGYRLSTLYELVGDQAPSLLLIKDTKGAVFGAYLTDPWLDHRHRDGYFGSGETFVFSLLPTFSAYPWVGINSANHAADGSAPSSFMSADNSMLAVGGGGHGAALQLDETLSKGVSSQCDTFNNAPLHGPDRGIDFDVVTVEVWCFYASHH